MRRLPVFHLSMLVVLGLAATSARAQGLLVVTGASEPVPLPRPLVRPRVTPPMSYKIKELAVNARVLDQVARVQVSQSFVNTGSRQMEVSFVFPLPYDGAIDSLTFLVDGKEYPAKLLAADEARKIYEDHIRRSRDPALLEWIGTGMFQTSVFPVPPGAERKVTLHYSQMLPKNYNLTDFLFPLGTAKYTSKPVEKIEIRVSIESAIKIKTVYSPTHAIDVKRSGPHHAVATYEGTNQVPANDFRLFYGVAKGKLGAAVVSYRPEKDEDGYFLLLASPQIEASQAQLPRKTVVCVLDRSGSMSGKKIEQAREALKFVLNNLREGDLFNIIAYDSTVEAFRPELQRYDEEARLAALGFTEGLYAGGSTNIHGALTTAMGMLNDSSRPSYVIFLTDGLPTAGVTKESEIVQAAEQANEVRARLLNFGVGYDVNSRLLDRLSRSNYGQSLYVRPNEDIEEHVSRLYGRISSPVMTDVAVDFEFDQLRVEEGSPVNRIYPSQLTDLFEGEQLVLVGRYKKFGPAKVKITGRVEGAEQKFDFPAKLVEQSTDQSYGFVEKLWAMRRIGQLIDELDLNGRNDELIKELVELSARHGILTPYTSFLADDDARPGDLAATNIESNARRARHELRRLAETDGLAAFSQREAKQGLMDAFMPAPAEAPAGEDGFVAGTLLRDIDKDEDVRVDAVQIVGGKTLYRRGNVWYAYDAAKQDLEEVGDKVKVIKRFSKEYFDLVRRNPSVLNKVMARQQAGQAMVIEAAEPAAEEAGPSAPALYRIE